jgi:hypothetical protein
MNCIMERVTATMDEETLSRIRRIAGSRGVSRFLAIAAQTQHVQIMIQRA